jgi:putative ABC transport system ATP-binding protein
MVKVKSVEKIYENGEIKVQALHHVNLNIKRGEFLAIMGASGSGKSTLLHIIGGIDRATSGEVFIDKDNISHMNEKELTLYRRYKMGFVFQSFNLISTLTVAENICIPLLLASKKVSPENKRRIEYLLAATNLSQRRNHKPFQLSGGEQQRVAIVRAFAMQPQLILMDEPTGNLDSLSGQKILNLIRQVQQQNNATVVLITHDPFAAQYTERIVLLKDGSVAGFIKRENDKVFDVQDIYKRMLTL